MRPARPVALLTLSLLACCGQAQDLPARGRAALASAEPAFHLRVRLDGEDEIVVWRVDRDATDPARIYSARLSAPERETAVRGLDPVLLKVVEDPRTREPDGASSIRLEVEADPMVPFKHVQWVMFKAADPRVRIYRLSLLGQGARERVDLELPKDRSCCPGQRVPMRELRLQYLRVPGPTGPTTQVRIADRLVEYDDGYMAPVGTEEVPEGEHGEAVNHDPRERVVSLSPSGGSWETDRSAWGEIEQEVRARWIPGERAVGIVSVPPSAGGDVPYRDVLTGTLLLRGLGVEQVMHEGPIAPLREEQGR